MSVRFNADEVFEIAEKMEQNAVGFYAAAAKAVDFPGARQLLQELSRWEEGHVRTFAALRKRLAEAAREATAFDPDQQAALYLQALTDKSVFNIDEDVTKTFGPRPSFAAVLRIGLGREKDAIAFYLGMKELVPPHLGRDQLDAIIKEEMQHVVLLTEKLQAAQA